MAINPYDLGIVGGGGNSIETQEHDITNPLDAVPTTSTGFIDGQKFCVLNSGTNEYEYYRWDFATSTTTPIAVGVKAAP